MLQSREEEEEEEEEEEGNFTDRNRSGERGDAKCAAQMQRNLRHN